MATDRHLVTDARDRAGFFEPASGVVVLCGTGPLLEAVRRALDERLDVRLAEGTAESCAETANRSDADLVLSFEPVEGLGGMHLHYWASYQSHSRRGDQLAGYIAGELARIGVGLRVEVTGMALPVLRETRMTLVARGTRRPGRGHPARGRRGRRAGRGGVFPQVEPDSGVQSQVILSPKR